MPQEYWRERTLKEIASAVGTLISIDATTRKRAFGHYARLLVDIDLSKKIFDEILVEREGFAFKIEVQYERRPFFCHHCYVIGHDVTSCRWLHPDLNKENRGKSKVAPISKKVSQQPRGDKGTSSSAQFIPVLQQVSATEKPVEDSTAQVIPDNITQGPLPTPVPVLELVTLSEPHEDRSIDEEELAGTTPTPTRSPTGSNIENTAENIETDIARSSVEVTATGLVETELAVEQTTDR